MLKSIIFKSLLSIASLVVLLTSCNSEGDSKTSDKEEQAKVEWNNVGLDSAVREQLMVPELEGSSFNKSISSNGELLAEFKIQTQKLKSDTLGLHIIQMEIDEWVRSNFYMGNDDFKEKSLDSLIARYEAFLKSESETIGFATNWEISAGASVVYNHNGLMTYELSTYSYTGGAHGNGMIEYRNYDIVSGRRIEIGEMFSDTTALKKILNEQFNATMSADIKEGIYVDEIPLTSNIRLASDSLSFYFNSYEIGPYAMGPVDLRISLKDLNSILKLNLN